MDQQPAPPVVTIAAHKLTRDRAWWQGYEVLVDGDGRWLFTPAGSTHSSLSSGRLARCEVEDGAGPGVDSLVLVPHTGDWLASWRSPVRPVQIAVDIGGWVANEPQLLRFVDWELDPFRMRSGMVAVEDLDDLDQARRDGSMSPEVADRTLRAAAEVERALKRSTPPFDDRGDRLLARCSTLGLAPLIDPPDPGEVQSLERFL